MGWVSNTRILRIICLNPTLREVPPPTPKLPGGRTAPCGDGTNEGWSKTGREDANHQDVTPKHSQPPEMIWNSWGWWKPFRVVVCVGENSSGLGDFFHQDACENHHDDMMFFLGDRRSPKRNFYLTLGGASREEFWNINHEMGMHSVLFGLRHYI